MINAMPKIRKLIMSGALLSLACCQSGSVYAINIEFDYSYDTQGFFTDTVTEKPINVRRERLEQAASFYAGFRDNLTGIYPGSSDSWSVNVGHPSLPGSSITLTDVAIANNTIRVYVGGSTSASSVLGFAGTGWDLNTSGSQLFKDAVISRSQPNAAGKGATDYGIWGGTIWFNDVHDWYFGENEAGLTADHPDFLTTATHELGHILGYGNADSWFSYINEGFEGPASVAAFGASVPVDNFDNHWAADVLSERNGVMQEAMMDPNTPFGERQLPTTLDYAGFSDIGWEVTAVPLPPGVLLFGTGLLSLVASTACRMGDKK